MLEIFVLKIQSDPMYFMPNGDIQAGILNINYGLYLFMYIAFLALYVNVFYLVAEKRRVANVFRRIFRKAQN